MADEEVGLRKNEGKPHVELCPGIVNELIGTVLWESAAPRGKYPMNNWRKGLKWYTEVLGSLGRHYHALCEGEDIDPESGLPHIAHLLTNAMFLAYYMKHGLGEDDRPKSRDMRITKECESCDAIASAHCHVRSIAGETDDGECRGWRKKKVNEVEAIDGKNCNNCIWSGCPGPKGSKFSEEFSGCWEGPRRVLKNEPDSEVEAIGGKNCGEV